jgi:hypothetical protein
MPAASAPVRTPRAEALTVYVSLGAPEADRLRARL